MVEEIDIKTIQKAKANAEKVKKVEQRKKDKEEVKQENKMLKVKRIHASTNHPPVHRHPSRSPWYSQSIKTHSY